LRPYVRRALEAEIALSPPRPCPLSLVGDSALLARVFENILENAFRYGTRGGKIAVRAQQSEATIEVTLSNDGPPLRAVDSARIFDKFRRDHSDGERRGNSGLGLYFCRRAVEAHGGRIAVVDVPGWPTSFVVSLPAAGRGSP
jgi:two-component system sensor histidine kinase VanS